MGLLMARKGMPRTLVLIAEQNIGMAAPRAAWMRGEDALVSTDLRIAETTVLDALKNGGFGQLIDPEIAAEKAVQVGGIASEITSAQARRLKSLTGAEVILFGRWSRSRAARCRIWAGLALLRATIAGRAVNTDNGDILSTAETTQSAAQIDDQTCGKEAIKKASRAFAQEMIKKIASRWTKDVSAGNDVHVTVRKVPSFRMASDFRSALTHHVRGVRNVSQRSFASGTQELDVTLQGSTEDFAQESRRRSWASSPCASWGSPRTQWISSSASEPGMKLAAWGVALLIAAAAAGPLPGAEARTPRSRSWKEERRGRGGAGRAATCASAPWWPGRHHRDPGRDPAGGPIRRRLRPALGPKSRVQLAEAHFAAVAARRKLTARLFLGRLWAKVTSVIQGDQKFQVETENAVAGVRGTTFRVDANEDKSVLVRVYDGSVAVAKKAPLYEEKRRPDRREVPGPDEVTRDEWEKLVGRQMQIFISADGTPGEPEQFSPDADKDDPFALWNQQRDDAAK